MKKKHIILSVIFILIAGATPFAKRALINWMMYVPETSFDNTPVPDAPDYSNPRYWAALPDKEDGADWLPNNSNYKNEQATAKVDVFFIHPTAAFYGKEWVAGFDNWLHITAVDKGIIPQQVSEFNGIGKIYAPRYRSVRMGVWMAEDKSSMEKARNFAYQDVKKSFEYYLEHYNPEINGKRRPFIIASHSQGTLHSIRLMREFIDGKPLYDQLIAAYIVGNTISDMPWFQNIPLCQSAEQTGCYVTWNTMIIGGDTYHWIQEKGLRKVDCVNPLSWRADTRAIDKSENNGSLRMSDYNVLLHRLPELQKHVVGARCGNEGMLWIEEKPDVSGYTTALFPGGSYHTYDLNFYYDSIHSNAALRTERFFGKNHDLL